MSTVEHIKDEVRNMSPEELTRFRKWFLEFDSRQWDEQIDKTLKPGSWTRSANKRSSLMAMARLPSFEASGFPGILGGLRQIALTGT